MLRLLLVCGVLSLAGCESNRWLTADREDVSVDGATYRLNWIRQGRAIDFRTHRNEMLVLGPDPTLESARSSQATLDKARALCGTPAPRIFATNRADQVFHFRVEC